MRLSIGIFYCVWLCCCINVDAHRLKRFIDADLHNRIDILSKSHDEHRTDTKLAAVFFFVVTATVGTFILLLFSASCYLYRRIRSFSHLHQSSAASISQSLNLSSRSNTLSLHQFIHVLTTILQRLDILEHTSNST